MAEIKSGKIIFDDSDWLATLNANYSQNLPNAPYVKGGRYLLSSRAFDPYRHLGYASPGFEYEAVANSNLVDSTPIRASALADESGTQYYYGVDTDETLFQIDADSGDITSGGIWPHTITPAAGTAEADDVIAYSVNVSNTRVERLFYSYNNSADGSWDVGMYELDGTAPDDDYLSTVPNNVTGLGGDTFAGSSVSHPMIVGDDDILYIGNGRYLYGLDGDTGSDGTLNLSLTLPENFRIKSFARVNHRLAIFGYYERDPTASPNRS
jgi:hypothetical protein